MRVTNIMRRIAVALLAVCLIPSVWSETVTIDRVAAIVDDDVVMESELEAQVDSITARMQAQDSQLPPREVLEAQVLEHLITQQIQLQMAQRAGVEVNDDEVDRAIDEMRRNNQLSEDQFLSQLQQEGLSLPELRDQIRREMVISRVQRGVLNNRIEITEHDVDSFLASQEGESWDTPDYRIGHILIPVPSGADDEQIQEAAAQAQDIHGQLQDGADFAQLATTHSAGQNALEGGDWGWRQPTELPELFAQQLRNIAQGEITEPFRSGAGFHLLKIHDQRGGDRQVVEETKVRHILLEPSAILSEDDAQQRLSELRQEVLNGEADFAELAKEHSDDIGSMLAGGDLEWRLPGQLVPRFEEVMQDITIDEISEPFRSEQGWHILQVTDRRQRDMSDEVKRNRARAMLRERRFEEELPVWLQEIRDEAYVEVKLSRIDMDQAAGNR